MTFTLWETVKNNTPSFIKDNASYIKVGVGAFFIGASLPTFFSAVRSKFYATDHGNIAAWTREVTAMLENFLTTENVTKIHEAIQSLNDMEEHCEDSEALYDRRSMIQYILASVLVGMSVAGVLSLCVGGKKVHALLPSEEPGSEEPGYETINSPEPQTGEYPSLLGGSPS